MYIFMDESGDLWTHSKHFIVSFLLVQNKKPIEKIVVKILNHMRAKNEKIKGWVLHSVNRFCLLSNF